MDYRFMPKPRDERVDLVNKTKPIVKEDREHPFWGEPASEEVGEDGHPFWGEPEGEEVEKDRTYLKPGEEAPEGTEEQSGPRGGRYYEGEPGAGEKEEPRLEGKPERAKPATIGDVVESIASGNEALDPKRYTSRTLVRLHALIGAQMDSGRMSERQKMHLDYARNSVAAELRERGKRQENETFVPKEDDFDLGRHMRQLSGKE